MTGAHDVLRNGAAYDACRWDRDRAGFPGRDGQTGPASAVAPGETYVRGASGGAPQ